MFVTRLFLLVAALLCSGIYGYTQLVISYYPANSGCNKNKPSPQANDTYILNKCYNGKMYDCDSESVTYMMFPDLACGSLYPNTYGLFADMCLSPANGYSKYDCIMWCE